MIHVALHIDQRRADPGALTWILRGDLVGASADTLIETWDQVGPDVSTLTLEFGAVTALDSGGVAVLVRLLQGLRIRRCALSFSGLRAHQADVLHLVGFARYAAFQTVRESLPTGADPARPTGQAGLQGLGRGPEEGLRIAALGPLVVTRGGQELRAAGVARRLPRRLLGYLLLQGGYATTRDALGRALWPEAERDVARTNLRTALHSLRRAIDGCAAPRRSTISGEDDTLRLLPAVVDWFDLPAFHGSLRAAARLLRDGSVAGAAERYAAAVRLYRGDLFLDDPDFEPFAGPRQEARRGLTLAQRRLALAAFEDGDLDATLQWLDRSLVADPCQEDAACWLIRLYAATGRQGEARRAYRRLCVALAQELDSRPAAETERVFAEIASERAPRLAQLASELREQA